MSHPRMLPDGKVTIKAQPNLRPKNKPHSECWRLDHSEVFSWLGFPGDVRRCQHGRIQIRTEIGPNARVAGPGTDWWRTLSRLRNPILYRRAKRALAG